LKEKIRIKEANKRYGFKNTDEEKEKWE